MDWEANPTRGFKFHSPVTLYGCSRTLCLSPSPPPNSLYHLPLTLKSLTLALPFWSHLPSDFQGIPQVPNLFIILGHGFFFVFFFNNSVSWSPGKLRFMLFMFQDSNCFWLFESYFFNHISFLNLRAPCIHFYCYLQMSMSFPMTLWIN